MNDDYNLQLWQKFNKEKQIPEKFMDCIEICSNTSTEIIYLLGTFDRSSSIKRKVEIFTKHSKLKFDLTLLQIDRWNIGEAFNIYIDGKLEQTWNFSGPITDSSKRDYCGMKGNLPIQQDLQVPISFEIDHITNVVEIVIETTISGSGLWGLVNFQMSAKECLMGSCLNMSALTFDLLSKEDPTQSENKRFQVIVNFNNPMIFTSGQFEQNVNYTIWEIGSGYTTSVEKINKSQYIIYLDLKTTIRNNYMNITFIHPEIARSINNMNTIVSSYNKSVELPTFFYYSQTTQTSSDNIAFAVWVLGIVLTLSLLPLIVFKQFEVVAYTYFVHQMIYYYSFSDVRMPYNIVVFFKSFQVYNFDFLPNIFKIAIDSEAKYGYVYQFNKESLFLSNAGYLYTLFLIFLLVYIVFKICANEKYMKIKKIQKVMVNIVKNIFEWNLFLEYSLLSFMHLLFAIFLQFFVLDFQYPICYVSFTLCIITIILLIIQFYYLITKVFGNKQLILKGDPVIERKYGVLWDSLKKDSFYFQTCFNMILIFRRLLFIIITAFLHSQFYIQYNIFNICNCFIIFIVVLKKPYIQPRNNFKVFISELQLMIIQAMIQNFRKDDGRDEDSRVKLGWIMISQIVVLIIMHYSFVGYEIIRYARYWFVKQINEAEEQLKQKIEKASEEQKKLLGIQTTNNNMNQDIPSNAISLAVDDNIHHRRRRRSSNFMEIISNSNKNFGEEPDKGQSSSQINDIQTIKSHIYDHTTRHQNRIPSIVVFSNHLQGEDHNIQPILKKTSFKQNILQKESSIQLQDQSNDNKLSQPNLNDSKEEDTFQPRMKRQTTSGINNNNNEQHMRHNRRKRNNTYISQQSIKSIKSAIGVDEASSLNPQQNSNQKKQPQSQTQIQLQQNSQQQALKQQDKQLPPQQTSQTNIQVRKRHRTSSKIFQEEMGNKVQEQISSKTLIVNPVISKESMKTDEQPVTDLNKLKQKNRKTKGIRVDSSQFQNIFEQIQNSNN